MAGKTARNKGAKAEREVVELIKKHGLDAHRGHVFYRESDVVGLDGYHLEVKRQETYQLDKWLEQSEADAKKKNEGVPLVVFRKSRQPWRVVLNFEEFLNLLKKGQQNEQI